MILVFYALLLGGLWLLALDILGRLTVSPGRARRWRVIGIAAAAGPGLAPLLAWQTGRLEVTDPFPAIALGYFASFVLFTAGGLASRYPIGRWLQRLGYGVMLALGLLPSFALLILTPLIPLAGFGLARSRTAALDG